MHPPRKKKPPPVAFPSTKRQSQVPAPASPRTTALEELAPEKSSPEAADPPDAGSNPLTEEPREASDMQRAINHPLEPVESTRATRFGQEAAPFLFPDDHD